MTVMRPSPIRATIDFDREGVQHGHLVLPHSDDASAWGAIMIPMTVVKHGRGPTALMTGGNHGDEYEGPIALHDLAGTLDPARISGRVIIVPAMNMPAFRAARRTSPIDGGNMNRVFPGRPDGSVTEKIADYFTRVLLPMVDVVVDIHAGGRTLDFVPFAASHILDDPAQSAACASARDAFAAPYVLAMREIDAVGMWDTTVEEAGKVFVTTELGGGGTATPATIEIARRGVRNVLIHAGVLGGAPEPAPSTRLRMPDEGAFVTADRAGLIAFAVNLGDRVDAGDVVARIHDIDRTGGPVHEVVAPRAGLLIGRHFPGLVRMGDTVAVLAVPEG